MATTKKLMGTTAAAGGGALAIEDVFSTYLYTGTSAAQTITNGIDLAGEGGLVWIKSRGTSTNHMLQDSERSTNFLFSDLTNAQVDYTTNAHTFNANGFTINGINIQFNQSGTDYASWTFRKAPRFFDVVTWTGNTGNRTLSHSLNSEVGMIVLKKTSATGDWYSYHRSLGNTKAIALNSTGAAISPVSFWQSTTPTSTEFYVNSDWNDNGQTYVAYLFAHNNGDGEFGPNGDADIIKCGSYTGNGSTDGPEINLGFEPQWLLVKITNDSDNWMLMDNMRGIASGGDTYFVEPNTSDVEATRSGITPPNLVDLLPTGFKLKATVKEVNGSGNTYIYIAIRRGPMRQPTSGTEVFDVNYGNNLTSAGTIIDSNMLVDMFIQKSTSGSGGFTQDRMRGAPQYLDTSTTNAEATASSWKLDQMTGVGYDTSRDLTARIGWMFRRAPGFFDVVAYTGDGVFNRNVQHNLQATPELIIAKGRAATTYDWPVYSAPVGFGKYQSLNTTIAASAEGGGIWGNSSGHSETTFQLGNSVAVNGSGQTYIAYLFATLPGVSKVGSYAGNGTNQTIDCGFTSGARFVLIKRTDSTGDWYVWDTERGIVAANDPHLSLNTTAAEVTTDDSVDPDNSGFIVNQVAATNINVSSASYIYLAIA